MTSTHPICRAIEPDLVAAATGEAGRAAADRVSEHVARCAPCRQDFERYRAIEGVVAGMRADERPSDEESRARGRLESRLADLRRRLLTYRIFPSPLGNILIARSEHGVSLVEYLGQATSLRGSRLAEVASVDAVEDGEAIETLRRELLEYLAGRRTHLDWPLDFRLARGDFDRTVLAATAAIPYGAVTSYARIARKIGRPSASRAVAQALRWNPLPLVVPCHRIIGSSGALVGYAGDKVTLKHRLLAGEGVRMLRTPRDYQVARNAMYARVEDEPEYCVPSCAGLASQPLAKVTLFGSRERAEALGLAPCTSCRPDLHPLAY